MKLLTHKAFGFVVLFFISSVSFSQSAASTTTKTTLTKNTKGVPYKYTLTGLRTGSDATNLIAIFKSKKGIIDATVDLSTHLLTVYVFENFLENDILEIIKFSGKEILTDKDLISKHYPY